MQNGRYECFVFEWGELLSMKKASTAPTVNKIISEFYSKKAIVVNSIKVKIFETGCRQASYKQRQLCGLKFCKYYIAHIFLGTPFLLGSSDFNGF